MLLISKMYVPIPFLCSPLVYFIINSLLNNPSCIIFHQSFMEEREKEGRKGDGGEMEGRRRERLKGRRKE